MPELPHLYSYSQLNTYKDCSQKYKYYYLDNLKRRDIGQAAEIGTIVHECIERFYMGEFASAKEAFPVVIDAYLERLNILDWKPELHHISEVMLSLLQRASANYNGPDAIRTADGRVSEKPEMTKVWKEELRKHNLESRIDGANSSILRRLPSEWASVKMASVYAEAMHLAGMYQHPAMVAEVKAIEFGFSDPDYEGNPNHEDPNQREPHIKNLAVLPSGRVFRGFIDLVGKLHNGEWIIVDHKSSKECPSELKVKHHEQLLLYAYFWNQLTGTWPAKIGISHLRSGTLVVADVVPELALEAVQRHEEIIRAIGKKVFIKRAPFEYGSPCLGRDSRLETGCPYLPQCHRDVALSLGWVDPEITLPVVGAADGLEDLPALTPDTY